MAWTRERLLEAVRQIMGWRRHKKRRSITDYTALHDALMVDCDRLINSRMELAANDSSQHAKPTIASEAELSAH